MEDFDYIRQEIEKHKQDLKRKYGKSEVDRQKKSENPDEAKVVQTAVKVIEVSSGESLKYKNSREKGGAEEDDLLNVLEKRLQAHGKEVNVDFDAVIQRQRRYEPKRQNYFDNSNDRSYHYRRSLPSFSHDRSPQKSSSLINRSYQSNSRYNRTQENQGSRTPYRPNPIPPRYENRDNLNRSRNSSQRDRSSIQSRRSPNRSRETHQQNRDRYKPFRPDDTSRKADSGYQHQANKERLDRSDQRNERLHRGFQSKKWNEFQDLNGKKIIKQRRYWDLDELSEDETKIRSRNNSKVSPDRSQSSHRKRTRSKSRERDKRQSKSKERNGDKRSQENKTHNDDFSRRRRRYDRERNQRDVSTNSSEDDD